MVCRCFRTSKELRYHIWNKIQPKLRVKKIVKDVFMSDLSKQGLVGIVIVEGLSSEKFKESLTLNQ